jgi:ABC-type antimicrobial peptide transport system permease subunit
MLGLFAGVALLLAMVGIYGVTAYSIEQRSQEMGIRRALGAQEGDILRMVIGQGLGLTVTGVAFGIGGALALTRVMKSLLFHTSTTDPTTFMAIALLFIGVGLLASYVPARRATRIEPVAALRIG